MYANVATAKVESYWRFLKDLQGSEKIALISRLSSSLLESEDVFSKKAADFYGVWSDDDFDDDVISFAGEIKAARRFKDSVEAF